MSYTDRCGYIYFGNSWLAAVYIPIVAMIMLLNMLLTNFRGNGSGSKVSNWAFPQPKTDPFPIPVVDAEPTHTRHDHTFGLYSPWLGMIIHRSEVPLMLQVMKLETLESRNQ